MLNNKQLIYILMLLIFILVFNMCDSGTENINNIVGDDFIAQKEKEKSDEYKRLMEENVNNSGITTDRFVYKTGGQTWTKMTIEDTNPVFLWCNMNGIELSNVEYGVNEKGVVVELKIENQSDLTLDKVYNRWTQLHTLSIEHCNLEDIENIGKMPSIRILNLSNNKLTDISPIAGLEEIVQLNLSSNMIEDISALKKFTMMSYLDLQGNNIKDISPIKDLWNIDTLFLSYNNIESIEALKDLINLYELRISSNRISNIDVLAKLTDINILYMDENKISDITSLFSLRKLKELLVSENPIDRKDIKRLEKVLNLKDIF